MTAGRAVESLTTKKDNKQHLGHSCIRAVGQLCDHNSPACGQFCRSSLWASVPYVISAYGTVTQYTLIPQPYIQGVPGGM
jgi:hypothetical protein